MAIKNKNTKRIDFSRKRIALLADKYYNEGNYLLALRMAFKELETYGGDNDVYVRLSDIYEGMELHEQAIKWWFKFLDNADEEDLPEAYEGLAVNYLSYGERGVSAYYYNKLVDEDDTLPEETKEDIIDEFSMPMDSGFHFSYPPQLVDYSEELARGNEALKKGNFQEAVEILSLVEKGSQLYADAKEMQAVALLLADKADEAEKACQDLLEELPDDVRGLTTLSAVYAAQGRQEEVMKVAKQLAETETDNADELYKIATVCCENGFHKEAYRRFCLLEAQELLPYDERMQYFKAVAAYNGGLLQEAEDALDKLCTISPDAEVARYYLKAIRAYRAQKAEKPELIYFYHLPQEERDRRCRELAHVGKAPLDEARLFGLLLLHDGYFRWCFDELNGGDHELQYLGLATAVHVRADDFIRDILLDYKVADVLKIETLRLLLERNEDEEYGVVFCNIYKRVFLQRIEIGRKRRKKFLSAYALIAAKFAIVRDDYGDRIAQAAERLYDGLEARNALDAVNEVKDCACAIFILSGLKELGDDFLQIAATFKADVLAVRRLLNESGEDLSQTEKKKR